MTTHPPGTVVRIRNSGSSVLAGSLWGVSLGLVREAAGEAPAGVPRPAYRVAAFVGGVLTEEEGWARGSHESVEIVVGAVDLEKAWVFEADEFLRSLRRLRRDLYLAATEARAVTQRCWSCGSPYLLTYRTHRQMPTLAREFECPGCRVSLKEVAAFVQGPEAERVGGS